MANKFKVGDEVVVTFKGFDGNKLHEGDLYTIAGIDGDYVDVRSHVDAQVLTGYVHWGFKLVTAPSLAVSPAQARKDTPIYSGVLRYFPLALAEVARCSKAGNDQHNPGEPLHWAREKSGDELDALTRHLLDAGSMDTDGVRHSTKVAWRALANLEKELEKAKDD